jgi:hypothetical protein
MIPFLLKCIRQRIFSPAMLSKLHERVKSLIEEEYGFQQSDSNRKALAKALTKAQAEVKNAARNLALLKDSTQIVLVQEVLKEMQTKVSQLEAQLHVSPLKERGTIEAEVEKAMSRLSQVHEDAADPNDGTAITELFTALNVRVFCQFIETMRKGRKTNRLLGGMITFGLHPDPVSTYQGPTGRGIIKHTLVKGERRLLYAGDGAVQEQSQSRNDSEKDSLRNENCRTPRSVRALARTENECLLRGCDRDFA